MMRLHLMDWSWPMNLFLNHRLSLIFNFRMTFNATHLLHPQVFSFLIHALLCLQEGTLLNESFIISPLLPVVHRIRVELFNMAKQDFHHLSVSTAFASWPHHSFLSPHILTTSLCWEVHCSVELSAMMFSIVGLMGC